MVALLLTFAEYSCFGGGGGRCIVRGLFMYISGTLIENSINTRKEITT